MWHDWATTPARREGAQRAAATDRSHTRSAHRQVAPESASRRCAAELDFTRCGPKEGPKQVEVMCMSHASVTTRWLRKAFNGLGVVAMLGAALALAPPARAVIPPSLEDQGAEQTVAAVLPTDRSV